MVIHHTSNNIRCAFENPKGPVKDATLYAKIQEQKLLQ